MLLSIEKYKSCMCKTEENVLTCKLGWHPNSNNVRTTPA